MRWPSFLRSSTHKRSSSKDKGRRKVNNDDQEFCRSIDYVLDSVLALKASVRNGWKSDEKGVKEIDYKGIWKNRLHRSSSKTKTSSVSLKQMEDALTLMTSLWHSLDDAIQEIYDNNSLSAGLNLALLPEDVLVRIFEMYIEMCVMPDYDAYEAELRPPDVSPQTISSVCKRFREIVLHLPSAWQHISLNFPPHILRLHKERCSNPTLHISPTKNIPQMFAKMHDMIHPYYQWREFRMNFADVNYVHRYFRLLKPIIRGPFHALEFLSIHNRLTPTSSDNCYSVRLDEKNARLLSSWRMPILTHLELRNVLPMKPMQCENVTFLYLEILPGAFNGKLSTKDFQAFLQSMPKVQSLSVTIKIFYIFFDEDSLIEEPHNTLPSLTSFDLKIVGPVPWIDKAIGSFMALIDTRKLTRFSFGVNSGGEPRNPQAVTEDCLLTIFPTQSSDPQLGLPFERLEHFSIEMVDHRGAIPFEVFGRIFTLMPNVRHVSLTLPPLSNIAISGIWLRNSALIHLRTLRVELSQLPTYLSPLNSNVIPPCHDTTFQWNDSEELERVEVIVRPAISVEEGKVRLRRILGEKLEWIEY